MNKKRILLTAFFILTTLLLTACKINVITDIKSDGTGAYIQEVGIVTSDLSDLGMDVATFCDEMGKEIPAGMSARQETRDKETWCIFETQFYSLEELEKLYAETETRINQISMTEDEFIYDISLDMTGEENSLPGITLNANWIVKMPGRVTESNASEQNGNTLTWKLQIGQENNIRAVSKLGGPDFGGDWLGYVLGGGAFLCLCCFVPLVIGGLVAVHQIEDELVWRLVKNLDLIRGKVLRRLEAEAPGDGDGTPPRRTNLQPHPAVEDFLLALRRT